MELNQHLKATMTKTEARVLGCLMEKQLTTPNVYPLTFNALINACNQKSNRDPIMTLSPGEVEHTAKELDLRGLVRIDYGERTHRVSQRMSATYQLDDKKQAILTVLMLHYPQTLNDIRRRTERMVEWSDGSEIELILLEFIEQEPPLVMLIPKGEGRREERYAQTLCGKIDPNVLEMIKTLSTSPSSRQVDNDRLTELEKRVVVLEEALEKLQSNTS
jgi:uncharacterized protein YceH (UPF0502 family)